MPLELPLYLKGRCCCLTPVDKFVDWVVASFIIAGLAGASSVLSSKACLGAVRIMLLLPPLLRLPLTSLELVVFARRYEVELRMLIVLVLRTKGVSGEITATFFFFSLAAESTSSF